MNKTEAMRVNTLLRWMMGDPAVPAAALEDARFAAAELARRAYAALGTGVGPGTVEYFFDEQQPRVLPGLGVALAPEVAQLLAGWWQLEGEGDGINGGDAVQFVEEWLTKTVGANITHPVRRALEREDVVEESFDGMDEWDEVRDLRPFAAEHGMDQFVPLVCGRCGGPIRDPENAPVEHAICRDCAGAAAVDADEEGVRA